MHEGCRGAFQPCPYLMRMQALKRALDTSRPSDTPRQAASPARADMAAPPAAAAMADEEKEPETEEEGAEVAAAPASNGEATKNGEEDAGMAVQQGQQAQLSDAELAARQAVQQPWDDLVSTVEAIEDIKVRLTWQKPPVALAPAHLQRDSSDLR